MSFKSYTDKEFYIRVKADINKALSDLKKLPSEIKKTASESKKAGKGLDSMSKGMQSLTRAAIAYFSVRTAISLVKQADAFNVLNVRIKTATRETGDYAQVQKELLAITQKNGVEFETTVALFQNLARSASELQATNAEMLKLTNLVEQLGVISGTSKAAQRAGLLQFSQGLSAGVFRAEEFNSLLENMPELANRIAKGMSKTPGELRKAVLEGEVLSKDVFDSLIKQSEEISEQFAGIPDSVERSSTKMGTSFGRMLSSIDKMLMITKGINASMAQTSSLMDSVSDGLVRDTQLEGALAQKKLFNLQLQKLRNQGLAEESVQIQGLIRSIEQLDRKTKQLVKSQEESAAAGKDSIKKIDVNENQDAIDKLIAALKKQNNEFGLSKEAIALYKLELMDASPEEIKLASAMIATTKAKRDHDEAMKEGRRVYEATRTDIENLSNEIARLNKLYQDGAFGAVGSAEALDLLARAVFDADEKFDNLGDKGEETFDELTAAVKGWGDNFTTTLAEMVQQGKLDFSSLADSIISDLLRIAIQQTITYPILQSLPVSMGGAASVQHTGGFAGTGPMRAVNPMLFAGAQRYHNGGFPGLAPDEVPAILQRGELVLTADQVAGAAGGGAGGGSWRVEIINKGAPAKVSQATASTDINGQVISILLDDINRGGALRSAIKTLSKE